MKFVLLSMHYVDELTHLQSREVGVNEFLVSYWERDAVYEEIL